jgi:hypothetical protein
VVTIKNYKIQTGLSIKIDYDENLTNFYHIKGPMGKGLQLKNSGTHIAFTTDTGCLAFMDLVALLLRHNLKLNDKNNGF